MKRIDKEIFVSSNTHKHSKKKKTRKILKFSIFLCAVISLVVVGYFNFANVKERVLSYLTTSKDIVSNNSVVDRIQIPSPTNAELSAEDLSRIEPTAKTNELSSQISTIIAKYPNLNFAVSFYDLNTNESFNINGDKHFTAASTTKLIAAGTMLKSIENGERNLKTVIDGYTIKEHLWYMLNFSNNYSWETLNAELTLAEEEKYAKSIGINDYNAEDNSISANDLTLILMKLAQGKLLNPENTNLVLEYINKTNEEGYLPAGLSPDLTVYHKYGLYNGYAHDAGIIKGKNSWYVLTIMSSDNQNLEDYVTRADIFHEITALFGEYN